MDEWILIRLDRSAPGGFERAREGNRAKFDLETARKMLLELIAASRLRKEPDDWRLVHHKTMVEPKDHSDWIVKMEAKHGPGAATRLLERTAER